MTLQTSTTPPALTLPAFISAAQELATVRDLLRFAVSQFNAANLFFGHGSDNAYDEAAYLILHALNLPLERLEPFLDARLLPEERLTVLHRLERRVREHLPAAYLTNEAWLGDYRFYVDERVIVPRSFIAELLEEQFSPWLDTDPWDVENVLDLCTGSGCLAILSALAFPNAAVDAVDLSPEALAVARRNVDDYGLQDRVRLVESNLCQKLEETARYDIMISNPPYVNAESMDDLPEEYRREPEMALAGGDDGLDLVHIILQEAHLHLKPNGLLIVEIGHNREVLEAIYPETPFTWLETQAGDQYVFMLRREELPEVV